MKGELGFMHNLSTQNPNVVQATTTHVYNVFEKYLRDMIVCVYVCTYVHALVCAFKWRCDMREWKENTHFARSIHKKASFSLHGMFLFVF